MADVDSALTAGAVSARSAEQQPVRLAGSTRTRIVQLACAAVIMAFAFLVCAPEMVLPGSMFDEPFYLLVGERMWQGDLPYVDIWDRKPIGLFIIYAAIRGLGGAGFVEYQVVSALVLGATAVVVWRIALLYKASVLAALIGAGLYVIGMRAVFANAGQSEVFFNLLTACSFWLSWMASQSRDRRQIERLGAGVMLLCGISLQIKYSMLPQCAFFGLWFIYLLSSRGASIPAVVRTSIVYMLIGLAPTIAAASYYVAIGHGPAFFDANFISFFGRAPLPAAVSQSLLLLTLYKLAPVLLPSIAGAIELIFGKQRNEAGLLLAGWFVSCAVGWLMIGSFYLHYAGQVLPAAAVAAAVFISPGRRIFIGEFFIIVALAGLGLPQAFTDARNDRAEMERFAAEVNRNLGGRGLLVFDGPSTLYMLTGTRPLTSRAYPDHLNNSTEEFATGIDAAVETGRALAHRPGVIVVARTRVAPKPNARSVAQVKAAIARDYVEIARADYQHRELIAYALRKPHRR